METCIFHIFQNSSNATLVLCPCDWTNTRAEVYISMILDSCTKSHSFAKSRAEWQGILIREALEVLQRKWEKCIWLGWPDWCSDVPLIKSSLFLFSGIRGQEGSTDCGGQFQSAKAAERLDGWVQGLCQAVPKGWRRPPEGAECPRGNSQISKVSYTHQWSWPQALLEEITEWD